MIVFKTFDFTTQYEHELYEERTRNAIDVMEKILEAMVYCTVCSDRFYSKDNQTTCRWCTANQPESY